MSAKVSKDITEKLLIVQDWENLDGITVEVAKATAEAYIEKECPGEGWRYFDHNQVNDKTVQIFYRQYQGEHR